MNAYRQAFTDFSAQLGAPERASREQQLDAFLKQGFPGKKLEDWRYTDLSALADRSYALASSIASDLSALILADTESRMILNGGDGALSSFSTDRGAVTALNAVFAREGLNLHVHAKQKTAKPIHVITHVNGAGPVMAHLRHRIHLEAGAEATVILHHTGTGDYLTTQVTEIELGANARLTLYRVQDESAGSHHLAQTDVQLGRDSQLLAVSADLGHGLSRHDFNVNLAEPGAQAQLLGLYAPVGKTHVDNHTCIHHRAPHCQSRESFRGIVNDSARAVFNGKVIVHEGASKTDSETRVANLLLSKTAEVYAKPELEIYNDDVKCAHGATFGQLDENAIFYLRSRGLDRDTSRGLLTYTFAHEVLGAITHEGLRNHVRSRFLERLPQGRLLSDLL